MPFIITGATVHASANAFYDWVFTQLCNSTPLNLRQNGVHLKYNQGQPVYSSRVVQKLLYEESEGALATLEQLFSQDNPLPGPTAEWSVATESQNLHLWVIYKMVGGKGREELSIQTVIHRVGGFTIP